MLPRAKTARAEVERSSVAGVRLPVVLFALLPLLACTSDPAPSASSAASSASPSASPTASAAASPASSPSAVPEPAVTGLASSAPVPRRAPDAPVRMTGDGIELPTRVVTFGDTYAAVQPDLLRFLGKPSKDTGPIDPFSEYGTCPGKDLRVLEYGGGALRILFGTMDGAKEMTIYGWALTQASDSTPPASALIGDVTTFEFGVGTTTAELREGAGEALEVVEDEMLGTIFTVKDQSSGFFGNIKGGKVTYVQSTSGCGE